jgi:hypothetical protein
MPQNPAASNQASFISNLLIHKASPPMPPNIHLTAILFFSKLRIEEMNVTFVIIKARSTGASMPLWHLAGQCAGPVGGGIV